MDQVKRSSGEAGHSEEELGSLAKQREMLENELRRVAGQLDASQKVNLAAILCFFR